jgi:chemotaxis protein MotB
MVERHEEPSRRPPPPPRRERDGDDETYQVPRGGGGARVTAWILVLLLLGMVAALIAFYTQLHEPLQREVADLRRQLSESGPERIAALEAERDAARAERDSARAERDALQARIDELSGQVRERDEQLARLTALQESLEEQLQAEITAGDVTVEQSEGRIAVRMADQILFPSGRAELSERGRAVLRRVATSLARQPERLIQVEGHTDSTPIVVREGEEPLYATNWELSTARATNVVRFLQEECTIPGERLLAAGFSEYRPVADNATAGGRRRNRRIELALLPMPRTSR